MKQLFKKLTIIALSFVSLSVHGMDQGRNQYVSFSQALMKADLTQNIDDLKLFVETGSVKDLNRLCPSSHQYPLGEIIQHRRDSFLVAIGIMNGARVDLHDGYGRTLFHWIAHSVPIDDKRACCFPKQNLLSALALPTYQYPDFMPGELAPEIVISEEEKHAREEKFKALRKSIKTFLLCVNKPEWQGLKAVRYILLAHMQGETAQDGIYCQGMFQRVVEYVPDRKLLVEQSPLEWFKAVAQSRPYEERVKFVKKFAPYIACYRLEKAQEVLINAKDNAKLTAYQVAIEIIPRVEGVVSMPEHAHFAKKAMYNTQETAHDLEPEGFIERHMPDCTRIIENVLLGKDPFDGFEFK